MAIQPRPSGKTSLMSSFYEQLVEHVFISEVLQEAWYGFGQAVEVLRSEIDASGYDVVFDCNGTVRHVQLKTSAVDSKTARQNVNIALAAKPSACVVWILRHEDAVTNRMKLSYLYFGGDPGEPLPSLLKAKGRMSYDWWRWEDGEEVLRERVRRRNPGEAGDLPRVHP